MSGLSVEVELSDQGWARLNNIANAIAKRDTRITVGAVFSAALELGTAVLEAQLKKHQGVPPALNG
jgi:predicted transcriptional regulator